MFHHTYMDLTIVKSFDQGNFKVIKCFLHLIYEAHSSGLLC